MILKQIYDDPRGYSFVDPDDAHQLAGRGLVEINEALDDGYGGVAVRLTPSGKWAVENDQLDEPIVTATTAGAEIYFTGKSNVEIFGEVFMAKTVETAPVTGFEITKGGFEAPKRKTIERAAKYPFEALEVGDSFLVAGKTENQFASTVTAANRKYSEETAETETYNYKGEERTRPVRKQLRKFAYKAEDGGVRVGRVL
jgi:hypothetical protein